MIDVKGERYEYEMNVLIECAQKHIPMRALPIETVYENNNEGSHFRAFPGQRPYLRRDPRRFFPFHQFIGH